jgi:tRNA U34 5-methylaminomethyl-2-thiouridine-forming methyltransferase MnmC
MKEFKGSLGNYKIIETADKSTTVWSEVFGETCHNLSGAYEETYHNYILGCSILDLITLVEKCEPDNELTVFDVGFGVGVGLKAFIDQLELKTPLLKHYHYFSIEIDELFVEWSLKESFSSLVFKRIEQITDNESLVYYQSCYKDRLNIIIFIGDGRKTIPKALQLNLLKPFDAIFQDAFSHRKNPTLWTVEWFVLLKQLSSTNVQLASYSSSTVIRKSLLKAGWSVFDQLGYSNKKHMTRALLGGAMDPDLLEKLSLSAILELTDN